MGERTRQAVEVIGDVAKKAKDAVMIPLHGAYAIAKAVVGREEEERESEKRRDGRKPGRSKNRGAAATGGATSSTASTKTTSKSKADGETESAGQPEVSLDDIWGVGASRADDLREAGFETVREVADAATDDLTAVSGIGDSTAQKMIDSASELLEQ